MLIENETILDKWKKQQAGKVEAWENKKKEHAESAKKAEADCEQFYNWLSQAIPGERYVYHIGEHIGGVKVAKIAKGAYEKGSVTLFQKRVSDRGKFEYIACKSGGVK
jgi:hypothetical protein